MRAFRAPSAPAAPARSACLLQVLWGCAEQPKRRADCNRPRSRGPCQTAGKGREHLQALGVVHAPRQVAVAGYARRQHRVAGLRPPRRQALLPTANVILALLSMLSAAGFMAQACKHSQLASHDSGRVRHGAKRVPGCKDAKGFATLGGVAGGRACRRSASSIISMPICPVASSRHMRQLLVFMVGMRSTTGGLLHMQQLKN